jgi:heat shock protein HslJ
MKSVKKITVVLFMLVVFVQANMGQAAADPAYSLAGTSWRLVRIMSMDDTTYTPDDPSRYILVFSTDGKVQIRADCNRGTGEWVSPEPNSLSFRQIASTKALCPPGSLHDRFMDQFVWVRSYVIRDGNLFLATMADGSIIEFEPAPLVTTVYGTEIHTADPEELQAKVLNLLFDEYARQQGIEATDAEIAVFVENMRQEKRAAGLTAEDNLTPEEAAQAEKMERTMGRSIIRQWKLNKALYDQYGGRIIFQQFGPEPLDAYRHFLEAAQAAGDFTIYDTTMAEKFWRYFTDDSIHSFFPGGSKEEQQVFVKPPWEPSPADRDSNPPPIQKEEAPASAENGGPLNWQVIEVTGGLNLRAAPSTSAKILANYPTGTLLDNYGCQRVEDRVWCYVQQFGGGEVGYVAAKYLTAAVSPNGSVISGPDDSALRAGQGDFDATGQIPCSLLEGQPMTMCEFGVARKGGGYATVVITKADGSKRAVFFRLGRAVGADTSQADGYPEFETIKQQDRFLIQVGNERYEIPEAVILGG